MKKLNTRIDFIDIFKCLAILLVIVGHINFANQGIKAYIYSFHMPLFFFIYGVIFSFKMDRESYSYQFKKSFMSKFSSILIPYLFWSLLFCEFTPKNLFYVFYGSHQTLGICSNSSLWFLPCYFISTLLFEVVVESSNKLAKKDTGLFYISIFLFTLLFLLLSLLFPNSFSLGIPFSIQVSFMGVVFMCLGIMAKQILAILTKTNVFFLFFLSILLFTGTFFSSFNPIGYVLMAENVYGNVPIFFLSTICGCGFILVLSLLMDRYLTSTLRNLLVFLGQNTLVIFVCHKPVISFMDIVFQKLPFSFSNIILLLLTSIVCIIFCSFATLFINHFIPALNGKKN